jgi:hypothetical protein
MASRTLRNRTVEPTLQEDVFTSQSECDWPHDQPEQLDGVETDEATQLSTVEVNKMTVTETQAIPTNTTTKSEIHAGDTNANEHSELKIMLASILTKLDKLDKLEISHEALQNKLETSYKKLENKLEASDVESKERHEDLQNKLDKLETSHRKLKESNGKLQKDIEIKLEKLQENMKTDLKTVTEKLIQRFNLASENQGVETLNEEKTDVILRRQGECVDQTLLQDNQVNLLDQDQNSSVECVHVLATEQIESSSES